jgi:hypothetical protein
MSAVTARFVVMAWTAMVSALFTEIFKKLFALYDGTFNKKALKSALGLGAIASLFVQAANVWVNGFELMTVITGLLTGTVVFAASGIFVAFLVAVNKDVVVDAYTTVKNQLTYWYVKALTWWALRNVDKKREAARENVKKAG